MTVEQILQDFRELTQEEISICLSYPSDKERKLLDE